MKMLIKFSLLILSLSGLFFGCHRGTDNKNSKQEERVDTINYVNLTILLDLSDRSLADGNDTILDPDQIQRDTTIIRNILNEFSEQVKRNGYQYSKDKIQVLIAPQANNKPKNFNPFIDIDQEVKANKIVRQILPSKINDFMNDVKNIYSGHPKFTGADIWTFFKDMPVSLLKNSFTEKSNDGNICYNFKNKMIILTDGYLVFDKVIQSSREKNQSCMQVEKLRNDANWESNFSKYKMKPIAEKDFNNLEVLLLEINPVNPQINTNEVSIIEMYWKQWFTEMNIKYIPMQQAKENIPLINLTIKDFITN